MSRGNWLREVIHIEFDFFDTGLGPRVIFCRLPRAVDQLHLSEIFRLPGSASYPMHSRV